MFVRKYSLVFFALFFSLALDALCDDGGWYTQGIFIPTVRYELSLINTLDIDRADCPVVIKRDQMPVQDLHEFWVTVVDPSLPPNPEPATELLARTGYHQLRKETNGHAVFHQLDDLDKDGVWDELFFVTNLKANETKTLFLYLGFNQRGWNEHSTHAGIGSYCRHIMPFWESAHVGWKLWYATDADVYGKRTGHLMSHKLYMNNIDGYSVPYDDGSDIMSVSDSFGGGGICLFESPEQPEVVSRPRFTPEREKQNFAPSFNVGQIRDTRYAFDVVVNGPLRSMIKAKTMSWNTGAGFYELEQVYTAYTNQSYSTCKVKFHKFLPEQPRIMFGCGIRKMPREDNFYQKDGTVITCGPEEIGNPDDIEGRDYLEVDFVGAALVVKDEYDPQYQFMPAWQGNHTFRIPLRDDHVYEYLIAAAWSEGSVLNTPEEFKKYILKTAKEYNNPIVVEIHDKEIKLH